MTDRQQLLVLLNPDGQPCRICGNVSPFLTASPLDPPGAERHVDPAGSHIPAVVERAADAPSGYPPAPVGAYPQLGERLYNLSAALREGHDHA